MDDDTDEIVAMRLARAEDLDFLWSMLFLASHADEQPGATAQTIQHDPDLARYLSDWAGGGGVGAVAIRGGLRIGAAWLRPFDEHESHLTTYVDDKTPELVIAVEPASIGHGVGSQLLSALLELADRAEIPTVVLTVRSNNPAARLYRRAGFVEIDRLVNRVGTHSVKMIRHRSTSRRTSTWSVADDEGGEKASTAVPIAEAYAASSAPVKWSNRSGAGPASGHSTAG